LNKLFTVLGGKFKFSAQGSDLEYLCWQCQNSPVSSDLKPPLAKVLIKAAFQQKFLRRHKRRPDFVRFWCSSFGYSMQQLFIIKQKGNAEYKPHLLIFYTFLLSIYICGIYGTPVSKGTLVGFIYTFWYSLWPTSSILE
jgi:hypothetical protein